MDRRKDTPAAALAEFRELAAGLDGAAEWTAAVTAFGEYLAEGAESEPWTQIAARIERRVAAGRPASFIRLGDGEGNLLALDLEERPALADHCARAVSRLHLGVPDSLVAATPKLLPALRPALRNAEVIGFPGPFGSLVMLEGPDPETYLRPIQGLVSVHRYLTRFASELELATKVGSPAGFHRGLLPHYAKLVEDREIGIVTCHRELADGLRRRMGASSVDLRPVPPQAAIASDPETDTGHWPHRYRELLEELGGIEPGRLWLVAAGMLGKVYCEAIRAAGGIAVDIGHTADVWAGVPSRFYDQTEVLATWRLV